MTVEPAFTRANRINLDSLDWSYIGDLRYGWAFEERAACEAAIHGSFTVDPDPIAADGPTLHRPGRTHLRGPRQRLRVDVLPDVRQLAAPDGNGEDEVVLERLIR